MPGMHDSIPTPSPSALTFLRALARNNRREWFEANRARYESALLDPMRALVDEMDARLAGFAPEFVGDRKRSVFRVHRDVRFSSDKRPYKSYAACWLFHRDAGRTKGLQDSVAAAGYYYHLEPRGCYVGGGVWMPPSPSLRRLRDALVADADGFAATTTGPDFRRIFGQLDVGDGVLLTRLPRGYPPDSPGADWLRYRSFTASRDLTDAEATDAALADRFEEACRALLPMMRWLNSALGYQPASRR